MTLAAVVMVDGAAATIAVGELHRGFDVDLAAGDDVGQAEQPVHDGPQERASERGIVDPGAERGEPARLDVRADPGLERSQVGQPGVGEEDADRALVVGGHRRAGGGTRP